MKNKFLRQNEFYFSIKSPETSTHLFQRFFNNSISSLKCDSGRFAKYSFTAAIASSFDVKRFPARNFSGLETDNNQREPNLVNMQDVQEIHSLIHFSC